MGEQGFNQAMHRVMVLQRHNHIESVKRRVGAHAVESGNDSQWVMAMHSLAEKAPRTFEINVAIHYGHNLVEVTALHCSNRVEWDKLAVAANLGDKCSQTCYVLFQHAQRLALGMNAPEPFKDQS